jgi:hypothetical protein
MTSDRPDFCECCGASDRLLAASPNTYRLCIPCFAVVYDSEIRNMDELREAVRRDNPRKHWPNLVDPGVPIGTTQGETHMTKSPGPGEPMIPTRGAMDPPMLPWLGQIYMFLLTFICVSLGAALLAIVIPQWPSPSWLWSILVITIVLRLIDGARRLME